jgi:hypothetical protein
VDFDFFGRQALDPSQIEQGISFLQGAKIIQRDKNTLSAIVDRGGPVKVSFFGVPTKASVVQVRAEAKDYIDIDALITAGKVELPLRE